jgi:parallel beta-helix repeat protein
MLMSGTAMAETITVAPGESINAALNRASAGDTVAVRAGTYRESVTFNGSNVKLVSADGVGAAHIVSNGTPLFVQGGANKEVSGFRLTAGRGGNGIQLGGTVGNFASGYTIKNNIVTNAGEDGIKVHQLDNSVIANNEIQNAGTGGGGNADGGIDFVAVRGTKLVGNKVHRSGGNTCLMLKGGSADNDITGNDLAGCKNAVHVGGLTMDKYAAPGSSGKEAYGNSITGNRLASQSCAIYQFDGEKRRQDNTISGNAISQGGNCPTYGGGGSVDTANAGAGGEYSGSGGGSGIYGQDEAERRRINNSYGGRIGGSCAAQGALSNAASAGGAVSSIFSGGRATAPLQIAQQLQLVAQRICQTEQLMAQLKMLTGLDFRTADDVLYALRRLEPMLKEGDWLLTDGAITKALQQAYPTVFGTETFERMAEQEILWDDRTRKALDTSSRIQNSVMQSQQQSMQRAGQIEQSGRDSGGIRGATLATNALINELMGSLNNQVTAQVAHYRALSEVQYRQEAKQQAADAMAEDFMSTLATCNDCKSTQQIFRR